MQIHGLGQVHSPQPINSPHQSKAPQPSSPSNTNFSGIDQLDISPKADFVSRVRDLPEVREDLVARIRDQIESGTYETDEKINIALGNLLDEIGD